MVVPSPRAAMQESGHAGPPAASAVVYRRLVWLLFFRTLVVSALLTSVWVVRVGMGSAGFMRTPLWVYTLCGASYVAILGGALGLRYAGARWWVPLAYAQLLWDAAFAWWLTLLAGGVESAFTFLSFLNVLGAAAVLGRRSALLLAASNAVAFALTWALHVRGALAAFGTDAAPVQALVFPVLTHILGLFLIAVLAGYLTEQLRETSLSLLETRANLVHLEALHSAVLRSLPTGVLALDERNTVVLANEAALQILARPGSELVGQPIGDLLPNLPAPASLHPHTRFEFGYIREGERILGGSAAALADASPLAGRVVVLQDLTELRQLQLERDRAERLSTLGRFAAGLAHEVRNPLAAIIGCLQLLESDFRDAPRHQESARLLGIVQREAERLSGLVTAFLNYARPAPLMRMRTDVVALLHDTVGVVRHEQPDVQIEIHGEACAWLDADAGQLRQVFWNLLGNALQALGGAAMPDDAGDVDTPGTSQPSRVCNAPPRIDVGVFAHDDCVLIHIDDNGPGIPEELRARIFEPFFTTRTQGTGLGLAATVQIVEAHGGQVRVADSATGGARFALSFPHAESPTKLAAPALRKGTG